MDCSKTPNSINWDLLAGLRFALAAVVVSCHMTWFAPAGHITQKLEWFGGLPAVLGFLVISGYSIAHSLERQPANFYRRRIWRIYPLYAAAILFSSVLFLGHGAVLEFGILWRPPALADILGNLCFLQNLFARPLSSDPVVWTLATEVFLYLCAPFLRQLPTAALLFIIAISAAAFAVSGKLRMTNYWDMMYLFPVGFLAWAWIVGFVLYRERNNLWSGVLCLVGVIIVLDVHFIDVGTLSRTTVLGSIFLVVAAPVVRIPSFCRALLGYLGDLSYPLYLFHLPTLILAHGVLGLKSPWLLVAAALAVSALFLAADTMCKAWHSNWKSNRRLQVIPQIDPSGIVAASSHA